MTIDSKRTKSLFILFIVTMLLIGMTTPPTPNTGSSQDINFRLMNIERKLDEQQQRIVFLERTIQNISLTRQSSESTNTTAMVHELQQQQFNISQQIVLLQKQLLDMQKTIDAVRESIPNKKETSSPKNKNEKNN